MCMTMGFELPTGAWRAHRWVHNWRQKFSGMECGLTSPLFNCDWLSLGIGNSNCYEIMIATSVFRPEDSRSRPFPLRSRSFPAHSTLLNLETFLQIDHNNVIPTTSSSVFIQRGLDEAQAMTLSHTSRASLLGNVLPQKYSQFLIWGYSGGIAEHKSKREIHWFF